MSALPPDEMRIMREAAQASTRPLGSLVQRWQDLHEQAERLATLAALSPEPFDDQLAAFPSLLESASQAQRKLAWEGLEDIHAMMQPGLVALQTITSRGKDAGAPALALWREFHAARDAVLMAVGGTVRAESVDVA
ncbi:MAG: hypothetical protein AAF250_05500 [Pseudomonadota bacterium]